LAGGGPEGGWRAKELKGKIIAATKGTDPYLFLLRTLNQEGLTLLDGGTMDYLDLTNELAAQTPPGYPIATENLAFAL
jgi:ABC-type nitrate/sulfonate/bicarbonate transport system substrate-binding protein